MSKIGTIENGVLVGRDGYLFLVGGGQRVLEIVSGEISIPDQSFVNFSNNLCYRAELAAKLQAKYMHVIIPDKHTVLYEYFPRPIRVNVVPLYLDRCVQARDHLLILKDSLIAQKERVFRRTDTHLTDYGAILAAQVLVDAVTGIDHAGIWQKLRADVALERRNAGDLGRKLEPPSDDICLYHGGKPVGFHWTNGFVEGNNGIVDIYFNPGAPLHDRILLFGDSFGRSICRFLPYVFREILFCRTGFVHDEIAVAYAPDILVSQQVERYFTFVMSDDDRPNFLTYPHLGSRSYTPSADFAAALSAVLSFGRRPHSDFMKRTISTFVEKAGR